MTQKRLLKRVKKLKALLSVGLDKCPERESKPIRHFFKVKLAVIVEFCFF